MDIFLKYPIESIEEKRISEYLQISMLDVSELDLIEYLYFLRQAFIYNCLQTEEGKEYLKNAARLEEINPDRKELRKKFKGTQED